MAGYTKQRNRFTAVLYDVQESYLMTPQQYQQFRDFFHNQLGNGADEFIKPDPENSINRLYRFSDVYEAEFNGVQYRVTLTMERLP